LHALVLRLALALQRHIILLKTARFFQAYFLSHTVAVGLPTPLGKQVDRSNDRIIQLAGHLGPRGIELTHLRSLEAIAYSSSFE
jgi:hypothetical protein